MGEVVIRPMQARDVAPAHAVFQRAFGTQMGMENPQEYQPDSGMVKTRFHRDPARALVAELNGQIVGSNFVTFWGSFGFFGPLTIDPDHWGKWIAQKLLVPSMEMLRARELRLIGLYTFADSPKHIALYRKFGFWPRFLTAILSKRVIGRETLPEYRLFSSLTTDAQAAAMTACRALCGEIYQGLDPGCEIGAVLDQSLGETIFLYQNNSLEGFAVCHTGAGTEAGTDRAYIKFAAISPATAQPEALCNLLCAVEDWAAHQGAKTIITATNLARKTCFETLTDAGFRTDFQGLAMHHNNNPGFNNTRAFVLDDWR
ncbi:MAG: GNAT family N-acetyltransferase [Alphaproteobacteria bacterium]|nr:GNAT family N-acetyltransferase [Alphaproteobacteria bacterium]